MSFSLRKLGLLAVALMTALVISCAGAEQPSTTNQSAGQAGAAVGGADSTGAKTAGDSASSSQLLARKITRTASLTLSVEDVGGAIQKIDTIATAAGGFVSESNVVMAKSTEGQTASHDSQT